MNDSPFTIEPETISAKTGAVIRSTALWNDERGKAMRGVKAHYNGDNFNVTIKPLYKGARACCFVQLSLPKYLTGSNFTPLTFTQSREAVKKLAVGLSNVGINVLLEDADLSRVDLFRNALINEPFCSYISLLSRLNGKRQHKKEFGTTFLWGNAQWSSIIYEKRVEMIHRRCTELPKQKNVIRGECQLKRRKLNSVGLCKVSDLWKRYADLPAIYAKLLKDTIFSVPFIDSDVIGASQLESEMLTYFRKCKRNWLPEYFQAVGIAHLCGTAGPETVLATLAKITESEGKRNNESKQKYLSRWKRDITNKSFQIEALRVNGSSSRTMGDVYRELESKLTA